jgi:hypothetical protein
LHIDGLASLLPSAVQIDGLASLLPSAVQIGGLTDCGLTDCRLLLKVEFRISLVVDFDDFG